MVNGVFAVSYGKVKLQGVGQLRIVDPSHCADIFLDVFHTHPLPTSVKVQSAVQPLKDCSCETVRGGSHKSRVHGDWPRSFLTVLWRWIDYVKR